MYTEYYKDYSPILGRDMECKQYGHAGRPVLYIPCQDGRFFDFENFHMSEVLSNYIESGRIMVFSIDTIDKETWSDRSAHPGHRSWMHEQWIRYIVEEMVPFIRAKANEANETEGYPGILVFGCSLGAAHAANLYFRFPEIFDRLLALSGLYDASYGFDDYMDEFVYCNSPIHYLGGMHPDHEYVELYNDNKGVICCGLGPWEKPEDTQNLDGILKRLGVDVWVDYWGYDCSHDWDWWYKQTEYFFPYLMDQDDEA